MRAKTFTQFIGESDEWDRLSLEDLEQVAHYGLVDTRVLNARRAPIWRGEFLENLDSTFKNLGIAPKDWSTPRQEKNGTRVFQLTGEQALRLILSRDGVPGAGANRDRKFRKMTAYLATAPDGAWNRPSILRNDYWWTSLYQYTITQSAVKYNYEHLTPSSETVVKLDGSLTPSEMLDLFIYRIALNAYSVAKNFK
jgi:hypothetical protein